LALDDVELPAHRAELEHADLHRAGERRQRKEQRKAQDEKAGDTGVPRSHRSSSRARLAADG